MTNSVLSSQYFYRKGDWIMEDYCKWISGQEKWDGDVIEKEGG